MEKKEISLEKLYQDMQEYIKMEEPLPFPEFNDYYKDVMAFLLSDYQELDQNQLMQTYGICGIISANAQVRAAEKDLNRKKFQKIAEKAKFWESAIKTRLKKEGLSDKEFDDQYASLWPDED
ncbi:MAG: hypothetical protein RR396_06205 [Clostridiales bacterium]